MSKEKLFKYCLNQPHDSFFKSSFRNKKTVVDFLKNRLPSDLKKEIDFTTIKPEKTDFLDGKLQNIYCDILYSVSLNGNKGCLYILIEQQTKEDKKMVHRLLHYNSAIINHHLDKGKQILPFIINIVLYTGKKEYMGPRKIIDAFNTPKIYKLIFEFPFLISLKDEKDENLYKDGKAALAEILLKKDQEGDISSYIDENYEKIEQLINESDYSSEAFLYIFDRDKRDPGIILEKFRNLDPEKKHEIMSGLQRVINKRHLEVRQEGIDFGLKKGRQEGIDLGVKKGRQDTILDLKKMGIISESIANDLLKK